MNMIFTKTVSGILAKSQAGDLREGQFGYSFCIVQMETMSRLMERPLFQ